MISYKIITKKVAEKKRGRHFFHTKNGGKNVIVTGNNEWRVKG